MEKNQYGFIFIFCIILSLGLVSFLSYTAAELKRTKLVDLKLAGKLCSLPESHAFGFGIVALVCLLVAQIMGNLIICRNACSREKRGSSKARAPRMAKILLFISWMSFGIAVILISGGHKYEQKANPMRKDGWMGNATLSGKELTLVQQL